MREERIVVDRTGEVVLIRFADLGVVVADSSPALGYRVLIFESAAGDWIGSVAVSKPGPLDDLDDDDLRALLNVVGRRAPDKVGWLSRPGSTDS